MKHRTKMPKDIVQELRHIVFREADDFNYCGRDRVENGAFIRRLVADPRVGGVISKYYPRDHIKTYIKDGILNAYSKAKAAEKRPANVLPQLESELGRKLQKIDEESSVTLLSSLGAREMYVVSEGTYIKWETALRKALLYMAGKPFMEESPDGVRIILVLSTAGKMIPTSDLSHLQRSLMIVGATAIYQ
jgi:hypothetical protein